MCRRPHPTRCPQFADRHRPSGGLFPSRALHQSSRKPVEIPVSPVAFVAALHTPCSWTLPFPVFGPAVLKQWTHFPDQPCGRCTQQHTREHGRECDEHLSPAIGCCFYARNQCDNPCTFRDHQLQLSFRANLCAEHVLSDDNGAGKCERKQGCKQEEGLALWFHRLLWNLSRVQHCEPLRLLLLFQTGGHFYVEALVQQRLIMLLGNIVISSEFNQLLLPQRSGLQLGLVSRHLV